MDDSRVELRVGAGFRRAMIVAVGEAVCKTGVGTRQQAVKAGSRVFSVVGRQRPPCGTSLKKMISHSIRTSRMWGSCGFGNGKRS